MSTTRPVRRLRGAAGLALISLLFSSCSLFSNGMYTVILTDYGTHRSAVLIRPITNYLYQQLWDHGAQNVATGVSNQMYGTAQVFLNHPWPEETAAHYTAHHPSDLSGALTAAASTYACVAVTFGQWPAPYNWTAYKQGCKG